MSTKRLIRSTTVLSTRRICSAALAGDGQVTLGEYDTEQTRLKYKSPGS